MDDANAEAAGTKDTNKVQIDEEKEKKMLEYEETMRLIKEATGVGNIHELIAKLKSQNDTHAQLTQLQQLNETRIEELKKKKIEIQNEYEELVFSGEAKNAHAQRSLVEFDEHWHVTLSKTQDSRQKYDRLTKLATNLQSGIQHLFDKLELISIVSFTFYKKQEKS